MYNLDYTYLTELEVDTRQTFSDLSDDLLLVNKIQTQQSYVDNTFTMKSLISSWQDFFWKTNNSNKEKLHVTFTDISIIRKETGTPGEYDLTRDHVGYLIDQTGDEMMSYAELNDHYAELDRTSAWVKPESGGAGKTFSQMSAAIINALESIHGKFSKQNVYPKGSIVVSDTSPVNSYGGGFTWTSQSASYIAENMKAVMGSTQLGSCGYHDGQSMGSPINGNLNQAVISAKLIRNGAVPDHWHKLQFDPSTKSGGDPGTDTETGECATYCNLKAGQSSGPYSGQFVTESPPGVVNTANALAIATTASYPKDEGDDGRMSFDVSKTNFNPSVSSVNFAPKPYSLSALIWERN